MDWMQIGIGPTSDLDLRVSVATLTKILFSCRGGQVLLALEHQATVIPESGGLGVVLKAQPFGGAVRLFDPGKLMEEVGGFHFDSERSRSERDFRIFINKHDWGKMRDFCLKDFNKGGCFAFEIDPTRELQEEFRDALGFDVSPGQFRIEPIGTFVEDQPRPTANLYAEGALTARVYFIFKATINDPDLEQKMVENSDSHSPQVLRRLALLDQKLGGRGRANAVLLLKEVGIQRAFSGIPPKGFGDAVEYQGVTLDGNTRALLEY